MAEVKVENLTKSYGRLVAVNDVSFSCKDGEFFTFLGPSGAGKTTTLELIAGIKKPDSGKIYIGDELVNELPPQERDVAMAFENYSLYPHFSVYENIAFPLKAPTRKEKLSSKEERKRVEEMANLLGIGELLDRRPQHLSGGQRQRVSLARAMVRRPRVYLLDEPIAHLDAKLKVAARTTLKRLATKLGTTIIYVTHDYKEALALSDRILILRAGLVEQIGTAEDVYLSPVTDFVARLIGDPPINLIDGELVSVDDKFLFKVNDEFSFEIQKEILEKAQRIARQENGKLKVRIGIRPVYVGVSEEKLSPNSFQLPVYAVEHEADSSIVTFELKDTFLIAKKNKKVNWGISDKVYLDFDQTHIHFFKKTLELSKR
ncbi:ABC transporter ATP-binding protein [Candidatus Aerophobetes bacterium]|nr:ABC transporter ATP-binding protein [Candidatus Aerophobetes bacterium]MBE0477782.1 ABC transporter ATP-binding protein [Candidatus Aerophobetes bacterium]